MWAWLKRLYGASCAAAPSTLTPPPTTAGSSTSFKREQRPKEQQQHQQQQQPLKADVAKQRDQDGSGGFGSPFRTHSDSQPSSSMDAPMLTPMSATATAGTPTHGRSPGIADDACYGTPIRSGCADAGDSCYTPQQQHGVLRGASAAPCSGASVVSTGRFLIEGGKVAGIPNTVSKYLPSQPVMPHVTPFEHRVERKLAEEEEVMKQQQQHEGQH